MPQTKQQRRDGAIERFRADYVNRLTEYHKCLKGGEYYEAVKKDQSPGAAEDMAARAQNKFDQFLVHACLDAHGNALSHMQWEKAKDDFYKRGKKKSREMGIEDLIPEGPREEDWPSTRSLS
jgi:hypothetical protein